MRRNVIRAFEVLPEKQRKICEALLRALLRLLGEAIPDSEDSPESDGERELSLRALLDKVNANAAEDEQVELPQMMKAMRKIRQAAERAAEKGTSMTTSKKMRDGIARIEESAQRLAEQGELDDTNRERLAQNLITLQRTVTERLLVNGSGDGIASEVDTDKTEAQVFETLAPIEHGDDVLARNVKAILLGISRYDGTPDADFDLNLSAGRLAINLVGLRNPIAPLAQLNMILPLKHMMKLAAFHADMLGLADVCEDIHRDPSCRAFVDRARKRSGAERLPSPLRIASYCLVDGATLVLHHVLAEGADPCLWLPRVQEDVERIRRNGDGHYKLVPMTEMLLLVVDAETAPGPERPRKKALLERRIKELGEKGVKKLAKLTLQCEDSDELVDALCRSIEEVFGSDLIARCRE